MRCWKGINYKTFNKIVKFDAIRIQNLMYNLLITFNKIVLKI